jgi:hypothetical protein
MTLQPLIREKRCGKSGDKSGDRLLIAQADLEHLFGEE